MADEQKQTVTPVGNTGRTSLGGSLSMTGVAAAMGIPIDQAAILGFLGGVVTGALSGVAQWARIKAGQLPEDSFWRIVLKSALGNLGG